MTTVLTLERRGSALLATIDDPARRNALSDALLADLAEVFAICRDDPAIRALVLRGNERVFCAGANLKSDAVGGNRRADTIALSLCGADIYARLDALPLPVIAAVEGAAMGGGLGLAACADIALATPGAAFALSEVRLGLVPAQIAPFVVARIGTAVARRLALTGSRFGSDEALRIGLIDEILPDAAALDARIDALVADIGRCGPAAVATTKALLRGLAGHADDGFPQHAAEIFTDAALGEGVEGIAAFTGKRRPAWATDA